MKRVMVCIPARHYVGCHGPTERMAITADIDFERVSMSVKVEER